MGSLSPPSLSSVDSYSCLLLRQIRSLACSHGFITSLGQRKIHLLLYFFVSVSTTHASLTKFRLTSPHACLCSIDLIFVVWCKYVTKKWNSHTELIDDAGVGRLVGRHADGLARCLKLTCFICSSCIRVYSRTYIAAGTTKDSRFYG